MNYIIITTRRRFDKELMQEREKARSMAISDIVDLLKKKKDIYLNKVVIKGKANIQNNAFLGSKSGVEVHNRG